MSSKEHCHYCNKLWCEESPDCIFNYHRKKTNEKLPKDVIEKLIFDDGRTCEFKIKIDNFPFLLRQKLKSFEKSSGRDLNDIIIYMLDNEIKSAEKVLGKKNV